MIDQDAATSKSTTRARRAPRPASGRPARTERIPPDDPHRRRLWHDITHELATIRMLATLLSTSADVGPASQPRAAQLLQESRWLAELLRAYNEVQDSPGRRSATATPIRLDSLAAEVVATLRLTEPTSVHIEATETWTVADELAMWRAMRNVLGNALRAAGPHGTVRLRVTTTDARAVIEIDDDGPGIRAGPAGLSSLGLPIVRDILAQHGGDVVMSTSDLGGGRVRLRLPAAQPAPVSSATGGGHRARADL